MIKRNGEQNDTIRTLFTSGEKWIVAVDRKQNTIFQISS